MTSTMKSDPSAPCACGSSVARVMFPDLLSAMGAAATPTGTAMVVPGGYRVSGRFPFVSGCHHCEWLWLGCHVVEDGAARVIANGVPETRQCLVRLDQCEILDTWYTTGLRGTGSNDCRCARPVRPGRAQLQHPDRGRR
jgi:hypothetical protein